MAFQTAPAWMENSDEHHAVIYRQFAQMVTNGASGVVSQSSLRVTEKDGTADMSVDVAPGGAYVPSTRSVHQGTYPVYNDAVINVPLTASHPTNDRIDRILVQVRDSAQDVALTEDDNRILVVEGEPASVPELPPVGVDDWIELARVLVPASASAITNADITDVRQDADRKPADANYSTIVAANNYSATLNFHRLGAQGFMSVAVTRTGGNVGANSGATIATAGVDARSIGNSPAFTQSLILRSATQANMTGSRAWYQASSGVLSLAWDNTWNTSSTLLFTGSVLLDVT